jgi:methionyl aminopeptidase
MLFYKTAEEIDRIKESCLLVSKTHALLKNFIKPGIQTIYLDKLAHEFICDHKAKPAFLNYHGFPNTLSISVNDTVVHGIPSKYELHEGDVVSIDCGVNKAGYFGDSCYTFVVKPADTEVCNFVETVKQALYKGIDAARSGNRIGDIGNSIQKHVESRGYSVVHEMVGHGIGKSLHESPDVPNYGRARTGILLRKGMVLAVEPMINFGSRRCKLIDDGWTLKTRDGKISAHFEHTICIEKEKAVILSDFECIETTI